MPHFAVLECCTIVFILIVIKSGLAQPNSEEQGADVYQLARTSARPNALIEITNRLTVPMVLLKKDLQFHGHTPLRPAPWNIDPMNFDAFLVSPLWFNKTGTYLSIYGAMVYEIREDQRSIAFALYFSVPDGHARHRFPWFGLEIYANDFERRMRDALEADYMPEGGVMTLNSYYCRFSYASAQKTLKVDNADYKIVANMKMTSSTTATIKVGVQPSRIYRGAPRTPVISQPAAPIQVQILTSTSTSSASTAAPLEDTSLSPSTEASTHVSVSQSEAASTSEQTSKSTSQVTEAGPIADEITTVSSSLSTIEASSTGDASTIVPSTTAQAQDADGTTTSTHEATSTTTQEHNTTANNSTPGTEDTEEHTSTVTEHVSSSKSDQESTTIIQTSSTTTEANEDESTTSTIEAVDPTTTTTIAANPDETMTDCDYDCIGEAQPQ